jgi:hypothetical protein
VTSAKESKKAHQTQIAELKGAIESAKAERHVSVRLWYNSFSYTH